MVTDHTALETFAPAEIVHPARYAFGGILAILLLSNVYHMYRFTMSDVNVKVPLSLYLRELKTIIVHFFTQMKMRVCESRSLWNKHILVMTGYTTAFILVQVDIITSWSLTNSPPPA